MATGHARSGNGSDANLHRHAAALPAPMPTTGRVRAGGPRPAHPPRIVGLAIILALVLGLLPSALTPARAQSGDSQAFIDLPKDHWAFKDVDFLIKQGYMEGYPDGTFKGRKVTTRYDLALILARILRSMEERKQGLEAATETERASLSRLTKEFRDELGLLGVRVDVLEKRIGDVETKVTDLSKQLPKTNITGFYRGRAQYIFDPYTSFRDEWGDKRTFNDPGLVTFYQEIYLKFTGRPLGDKIEVFYELYGFLAGRDWNKLIYNDVGKTGGPNPFDRIDDYVTRVQYDRYVQSNKLHFISNARSMKVRVFNYESVTGINDPINILTEDTNIFWPHQGIEFSGTDRGLTYQAHVLRREQNKGFSDLSDIVAGRLVWKLPAKFSPDSITVGTSYAEKINGYKVRGDSNTVRGVDAGYSTERAGKLQATAQFLTSTDLHTDTRDNRLRNLWDQATKFDASYQRGGFTGTVKRYDMGREFRAHMAPIWAYDIGDEDGWKTYPYNPKYPNNYKHDGFWGEKLTRFSLNYDFGNKLLSIAKAISMEATYLTKTWEVDPFKPQPTDGYSGKKFTYQMLADFNDTTKLKYDFEQKKDALPSEAGEMKNTVELDLQLTDSVNSKGKVYIYTDHDEVHEVGELRYKYNERDGYFELNSNINPRVYAMGSVEHKVTWVNAPKERTTVEYIGELTYNLTPTTTLIGGVQHLDIEDLGTPSSSSIANALIGELKKNFTQKFRGRATYGRALIEYKDAHKDDVEHENIYGELIYDISKDASIKIKFGYDYPDNGRWDIARIAAEAGLDKDITTQKFALFEAKTNF